MRSIAPLPKLKVERSQLFPVTPVINIETKAEALSQKVGIPSDSIAMFYKFYSIKLKIPSNLILPALIVLISVVRFLPE